MLGRRARASPRLAVAVGMAAGLMGATVSSSQFGVESVSIQGFAFSPSVVTVHVGDSVEWTNNDVLAHTATANDAPGTPAGSRTGPRPR
jgi:plastocyanin